jgi:hypothetical protein
MDVSLCAVLEVAQFCHSESKACKIIALILMKHLEIIIPTHQV